MMMVKTRGIALLLACTLFLPGAACAQTEEVDHVATLEARIAELEAQLKAAQMEVEAKKPDAPAQRFAVGEALTLPDHRTLTVTSYDISTRFRYSPAGGLSTLTLAAKKGYLLLCLYVTVSNQTADDLYTAQLLDVMLTYGEQYTNKAQDSFFYRNSRGVLAGGLKAIKPKATVEGCLLFAVPETVETEQKQVAVRLRYGDQVYECVLSPSETD